MSHSNFVLTCQEFLVKGLVS